MDHRPARGSVNRPRPSQPTTSHSRQGECGYSPHWTRGPLGTLPLEGLQKRTALRRQVPSHEIRWRTGEMHSPMSLQDPGLPLLRLLCRSLCPLSVPTAVSQPPTSSSSSSSSSSSPPLLPLLSDPSLERLHLH